MQNPLRRPRNNPPAEPKSEKRGDPDGDGYVASDVRGHFVAMSGEFVGTTLFLFYAFAATQIANTLTPPDAPSIQQLMFISLAFGFSLAVTAWVFFRISGGLFNPAVRPTPRLSHLVKSLTAAQVTFGMVITGTLPKVRGALLLIPQMLGGMVAAGLVSCMFPGPLQVETTLQNGTSVAQGLFIEMFLTIELVITVLFLAAEKHKSTFIAPVGIGLSLFVAELAGMQNRDQASAYFCFDD